jgi:predicted nucleic acid-binding protein
VARAKRGGAVLAPERVILDSGAVIAWSRGDARVRATVRRAVELGLDLRVPVVVLAETLRGSARDAPVNRVLKSVDVLTTGEAVGRAAGRLLGRTGGENTADALVAAEAVEAGATTVLTTDPDDLATLLADQPEITVRRV